MKDNADPRRIHSAVCVTVQMTLAAQASSAVKPRREGGPSSIYFAPASQAACDPVVRRAEHFGIGGVFSH
jgi:hypothetical protein